MASSGYFHFANPIFYFAAPVVQVNLKKLDVAPVHPAKGFVCMSTRVMAWMHWPWNRWGWRFLLLRFKWLYGHKILMSHFFLFSKIAFSFMCLPCETTGIRTDWILECNCFSCASSKSWWRDGVNFHKIHFLSIVPGGNKALGHKKRIWSLLLRFVAIAFSMSKWTPAS